MIEEIMAIYRDLPFVLIGDSGQHDPVVYREAVERHGERILAVYIRDVTAHDRRISREIDAMKAALRVEPARSAVVTIDCQRGNLDPAIASLPVPEAESKRILAGLNRLIGGARALAIPVIHVDTVYEPSLLGTHPFERAMVEAKQSFTPHMQSDFERHKNPGSPEAELMPDLDVRSEDYRVGSKRTFDSFYGTQLEILLRSLEVDTLLVFDTSPIRTGKPPDLVATVPVAGRSLRPPRPLAAAPRWRSRSQPPTARSTSPSSSSHFIQVPALYGLPT
jgi:hypothetical protein